MKFKDLLMLQSAVIPNMHVFTTSSSVSLECLSDMHSGVLGSEAARESVALADQTIADDGIMLSGGQYHPDNTSMGRPFTLRKALAALESIAASYDHRIILRPGTLIEFANYIYGGGEVTYNCLVVGDERCPTYFQFSPRDSEFMLWVRSKVEHPADEFELEGCHGIFVVAEPRS